MTDTTAAAPGAPALIHRRCNPYGHETGGPKRLLGGLYGPEAEGRYKWYCRNEATARFRAHCACGHRGQEMWLCPEHRAEIQRRQMGLCPPCAWPPPALGLFETGRWLERELAAALAAGDLVARSRIIAQLNANGRQMNELAARGLIHRCPLQLLEVS